MLRRLIRKIKHRWAIYKKQDVLVFNDLLPSRFLPNSMLSDKLMDKDVQIFNMGYRKKLQGYLVVASFVRYNKNNKQTTGEKQ